MTLTSKYEPKQKVYIIKNSYIQEITVYSVHMSKGYYDNTNISYKYIIAGASTAKEPENKVFSTKQEATEEWLKLQGLDAGLKEIT